MYDSQFHGTWKASAWYKNPKVDELLRKARGLVEQDERAPLYEEATRLIVADCPDIWIYNTIELPASQPGQGRALLPGRQRLRGALDEPSMAAQGARDAPLCPPARADLRSRRCSGLLVVTFLLIRVVPADPAAALAGDNATPQQIEAIRHQYGFDRPIAEQLLLYLGQVLRFDFGESQYSHRPVGLDLRTAPAGHAGADLRRAVAGDRSRHPARGRRRRVPQPLARFRAARSCR